MRKRIVMLSRVAPVGYPRAEGAAMSAESSQATETAPVESHIEALRKPEELLLALGARIEALEAQVREPKPSWLSPKTVAVIGSMIAALIPLTTAIDGYLKWRADLAVAAQQQLHATRMDSLKTVLSAQLPELERESRLRLLIAMLEPDDAIYKWAVGELGRVEKTVQQLQEEKAAALQEREAWEQKAASAAAKIQTKPGTDLSELLRGLPLEEPRPAAPEPTPNAAPAVRPPKLPRASEVSPKLAPEALEYRQAKIMSEAAASKANVRSRRLTGQDLY
jgi:hypothetical protein